MTAAFYFQFVYKFGVSVCYNEHKDRLGGYEMKKKIWIPIVVGTALLAVVLLGIGIVATSILSAILVGALLAFFFLMLTGSANLVRNLNACGCWGKGYEG